MNQALNAYLITERKMENVSAERNQMHVKGRKTHTHYTYNGCLHMGTRKNASSLMNSATISGSLLNKRSCITKLLVRSRRWRKNGTKIHVKLWGQTLVAYVTFDDYPSSWLVISKKELLRSALTPFSNASNAAGPQQRFKCSWTSASNDLIWQCAIWLMYIWSLVVKAPLFQAHSNSISLFGRKSFQCLESIGGKEFRGNGISNTAARLYKFRSRIMSALDMTSAIRFGEKYAS